MPLRLEEGWTIPADAPFYPPLPAVYRHQKLHLLFFTARPEVISRFLPEPLEASPDGVCVAAGVEAPFCTNYGPFLEAFLNLKCTFRGKVGFYWSHAFHNGPAGIAAGREIWGTPKVFAELSVTPVGASILTQVFMGGIPVLRLSTVTDQVLPDTAMPNLNPGWRLKIIPRADGPGPAIKQLVDGSCAVRDEVVHFLARGKGAVTFGASPFVDLSALQPISYGDAYFIESSCSEGYGEIVYDYLTKECSKAP
jgi:acetoacetate decarboxylase